MTLQPKDTSITLYRPISEFERKGDCFKCGKKLLSIKIKTEAILFCPNCDIVMSEWYD